MMYEMLMRRFTLDPEGRKKEAWKSHFPDLLIIDGGAGQLRAAREVLNKQGITIPLISLAKKNEEIYFDPDQLPLVIAKDSPALHLLQHVRDESHRFALAYHRRLRAKAFKPTAGRKLKGKA
jgi:excinuclease ABC subunit C